MSVDLIMDKLHTPTMADIALYVEGEAGKLWREATRHIEDTYGAKPQIAYSICAGKPGWNVKYKKSGKALCTLYPERDGFTALVVLGQDDRQAFDLSRDDYSEYVVGLFERSTLFNGTKWLMIKVQEETVLEDFRQLLALKQRASRRVARASTAPGSPLKV